MNHGGFEMNRFLRTSDVCFAAFHDAVTSSFNALVQEWRKRGTRTKVKTTRASVSA